MPIGPAVMCTYERWKRISFVVLNICFCGFGIALFTGACIVRYDQRLADNYLNYSSFRKALESANVTINIPDSLNIGETLNAVCIVFIVIGVVFLLLGIMGIFGAVFTHKALLISYAVTLLVFVVLELMCVVLVTTLSVKFEELIKDFLKDSIKKNYTGITGNDTDTLRWNFIMHSFQCCGVEKYTDFYTLPANMWNREISFGSIVTGKQIPYACCKDKNDANCVMNPNSTTSFIERGCYQVIRNWVTSNNGVVIGVVVIIFITELVLLVLAFVICCTLQKNANESDEKLELIETYKLPHVNLKSHNQDRINLGGVFVNPVYDEPTFRPDSVEIYPPRQSRGLYNTNNEANDSYDNGDSGPDSNTESSLRKPEWMSLATELTSDTIYAKPIKRELRTEYPERTAPYRSSVYVGAPPSEIC